MNSGDQMMFHENSTGSDAKADTQNMGNRLVTIGGLAFLSIVFLTFASCAPDPSDSISRSADVTASPDAVWAAIGPLCSIQDWHPAIGTCEEDGAGGRTLVTADGAATIAERQVDRNDETHFYTYSILSGPFPFTDYVSTISVEANDAGGSTMTWSATYVPNEGAEEASAEILTGIYDAGLGAVAASFAE